MGGPSVALDTACSSSLVGTHLCKLALIHQDRLDAGISGGLMCILSPFVFIGNCSAHMLSPEGRCFTFNASGNGFLRSEAIGFIGMKFLPYSKDTCFCTVSATNANQDGRSASMTAPSGPAQVANTRMALSEHQISPNEIDISECHGTATALGDPIEVGSVR